MRDESFINSRYAKLVLKFIPRNSLLIFLDADYNAIVKRRGSDTENKEYIMFQRYYYNLYAYKLTALIIDTSDKSINETNSILADILQI
jgi:hypothetical protein